MQHQPPTTRASERVVAAVASREGVGPTELPPLYGAIDPDALDDLVGDLGDVDGSRNGTPGLEIEFTYHGYDATVTAGDRVRLVER